MEVWRRRREAASARLSAAPHSAQHKLYSETVVSSIASAVALAEAGLFKKAVQHLQKATKTLYEAARDVFEQVKVSLQRLTELFVEAVANVLALVDEHKAYLFLMVAVAAGAIALSAALNLWGLIELGKSAYAASLTPFIPAGVKEYSREEVFKVLREAPDPYERFKEVAKAANAGGVKLAEPWESLRVLIMPKPSEEKRLMMSKAYRELDEGKKKALFYAALALEEAFGVYKFVLRKYAEERGKAVQKREVGEGPFKKVVYAADLERLRQLAEEEGKAFEEALKILREKLNEYAVRHGLGDLLGVSEDTARELAEAKQPELSEFNDVNFGVKALAALIAYREYELGRRGVFGKAAGYWLEVGGSAWLLYYTPSTAHSEAERAKVERPAEVGEMVAEALRRLFLKPGADRYRGFVELLRSGKLTLMPERAKSAYVFRLYRVEEGGGLKELGIKLRIAKVGEGEGAGMTYTLIFDVERWLGFFKQELETAMRAAVEVGGRLPVEDSLLYMAGWVDSDVAIVRNRKGERVLRMTTSYLWQLAETHALFGWSRVVGLRMTLTLEGPKLVVMVEAPLDKLDEAIRRSAEGEWLKMLGVEAGLEDLMHVKSWDGLKRWVVGKWSIVVDAAVKLLGEGVRSELEALRDRLNDDKIAREVVAPALLLIQAERLGVNEETLRYFAAVISSTIGGDGYVSAAMGVVGLASGERAVALLWGAALAAYGIKTEVERFWSAFNVATSGVGAARLARLYFLFGPPLLEGDDRLKNHKLAEAVELGAEELSVSWEGLRRTDKGYVAADLTISGGNAAVKYNVYLRNEVVLEFHSTNWSRVELAARLLRLAGVSAEVRREGGRGEWRVEVSTNRLAAGRVELRKALAEIVREAIARGWIDAGKAGGWLEKLEGGVTLKEGWPRYKVRLVEGALVVRFGSTNPDSIQREAQRLREMGLEEGKHFTVKMPEGGRDGYVYIRREGLEHAAWLSVHGSEDQRKLAAEFVEHILQRAKEEGGEVYEKASKIIEEGMSRGSLKLEGFEKKVEVEGKEHMVKVIGGGAEIDEGRSGKKLLRIRITAEVDRIRSEYTITFSRRSRDNAAVGFATARADAPDGREADAERLAAVIEALTGVKPRIRRMKDGTIIIECGKEHLEGFARFAELASAIARWLEETGGR